MNKPKHIILFSHGFGVKKDDRGLFTDIAAALPDTKTIMFDYNDINEKHNTLSVKPFSEQANILQDIVEEQRQSHPDAIIDLICHSQGCRIASVACVAGIRKTIFLAPPTDLGIERTLARYKNNPKAHIDLDSITTIPRSDGSMTIIPSTYWNERKNESHPIDAYNHLAEITDLYIIKANQDTVLGETSFKHLNDNITLIELDGDHDFSNTRTSLIKNIKEILF